MIKTEAILLVWGVRDEILKLLPVEGHWLYGEYDFIAKVEFEGWAEMEEFEKTIRALINGNTYKLLPVISSGTKIKGAVEVSEPALSVSAG
ncbi:hypothetical protein A3L09_09465 [Thermococcus profundus]|uniref:Transcription regulator AsnC/Lrp ligand binding domain-containing protein n=1 Tax=Thermococcus profundus TaxID=49899 RepID=A0A2Z2MM14_THEPR|nr:hypothetical protein [Thermococcus profundus]ASJ03471.1 hypothetical protein A3L09_09465 [Thermococcus profundus]